jgi:hypothetical protein
MLFYLYLVILEESAFGNDISYKVTEIETIFPSGNTDFFISLVHRIEFRFIKNIYSEIKSY